MLLHFSGCGDHYDTATLDAHWTGSFNAPVVNPTGGRDGGGAIELLINDHLTQAFPADQNIIFGVRMKVVALPSGDQSFVQFLGGGVVQVTLEIDNTGAIVVNRSTFTEIGRSAAGVVEVGNFIYLEVEILCDNSPNGRIVIRKNGAQIYSLTGVDTQASTATTDVSGIKFIGNSSFTTFTIDDFYVIDTSGAAPQNTFLGDVRVDMELPTGDGVTSDFDTTFPASPTTHYTKLDENPPTGDTDYNETNTANDEDMLTFDAIPSITGGSVVLGVAVHTYAKKLDAGVAEIQLIARPTSTNYSSGNKALTTDYADHVEIWQTNPQTAVAWTDGTVNASEWGVKAL